MLVDGHEAKLELVQVAANATDNSHRLRRIFMTLYSFSKTDRQRRPLEDWLFKEREEGRMVQCPGSNDFSGSYH